MRKKQLKKYKWTMIFKNGTRIDGECEVRNLKEAYKLFLADKYTEFINKGKAYYYNKQEILCFEIKEEI